MPKKIIKDEIIAALYTDEDGNLGFDGSILPTEQELINMRGNIDDVVSQVGNLFASFSGGAVDDAFTRTSDNNVVGIWRTPAATLIGVQNRKFPQSGQNGMELDLDPDFDIVYEIVCTLNISTPGAAVEDGGVTLRVFVDTDTVGVPASGTFWEAGMHIIPTFSVRVNKTVPANVYIVCDNPDIRYDYFMQSRRVYKNNPDD